MQTMAPKLREQGAQPHGKAAPPESPEAALLRSFRGAIENYLNGRKLVALKIRQVEGKNVDGILKILGAKGELQMVDFKATTEPHGGLSYLEVGGRKIVHRPVPNPGGLARARPRSGSQITKIG